MFQNVIMPEVTLNDMKGVMSLLALIGNPQSQAATEFLKKISEEKDAAVASATQAAADKAAAQKLNDEAKALHQRTENELADAVAKAKAKNDEAQSLATSLAERDGNLRTSLAAHVQTVAIHKQKSAAADLAIQTRENAVTAREQKLDRDIQELEARHVEFDRQMAPVIAAAKLAK